MTVLSGLDAAGRAGKVGNPLVAEAGVTPRDDEREYRGPLVARLLSRESSRRRPSGWDGHLQPRQRQPFEHAERLVEARALRTRPPSRIAERSRARQPIRSSSDVRHRSRDACSGAHAYSPSAALATLCMSEGSAGRLFKMDRGSECKQSQGVRPC